MGHFRLGRRRDDENIQPLIAMTGLTYENPTSSRRLLFRFCSPQGPAPAECNASRWRAGGNYFLLPQTCSPDQGGIMGISRVRRAETA